MRVSSLFFVVSILIPLNQSIAQNNSQNIWDGADSFYRLQSGNPLDGDNESAIHYLGYLRGWLDSTATNLVEAGKVECAKRRPALEECATIISGMIRESDSVRNDSELLVIDTTLELMWDCVK